MIGLRYKSKNIIKDSKIKDFTFRYQTIKNLPSKELRTIIDSGKHNELLDKSKIYKNYYQRQIKHN